MPFGRLSAVIPVVLALVSSPALAEDRAGTGPEPALAFGMATGKAGIARAWYHSPTTRYDHFVQGRQYEAAGLAVTLAGGETLSLLLPETLVFEDTTPRLGDLDGDGMDEIVTILSSLDQGASVAVFAIVDGALQLMTRTAFIGQPHRWLNIAGLGDFDGDGRLDIASVAMPHLVRRLDILALESGELRLLGSAPGFTNHRIGSTHTDMSLVADLDGDGRADLIVPDADRMSLRRVRFAGGTFTVTASPPLPAPADGAIELTGDGQIRVGLENGATATVSPDAFAASPPPGS